MSWFNDKINFKGKPGGSKKRYGLIMRTKTPFQFFRAIMIGITVGTLALVFQYFLWYGETFRTDVINLLQSKSVWFFPVVVVVIASIAGFVGWMTTKFSPEAAGSGIPHVKDVLEKNGTIRWQRVIPVKFIGGLLAIGSGFALGREGPTVQMGAATGSAIADLLKSSRREKDHLIACGAGAGLAAAFNAPLAGFIFVIEELRRDLSPSTYGTAFIASLTATLITQITVGQIPSFHLSDYPTPELQTLPFFLLLGICGGLIGVLFNRSLFYFIQIGKKIPARKAWLRSATVGVFIACGVWLLPNLAGGGHAFAETLLKGNFQSHALILMLGVLLIGKLLFTSISFASGVPGGIFAPMLLMGALLGTIIGKFSGAYFPHLVETPAAFAVVGMASIFVSSVRAPLTGIVLILEMTGNYQQLFPLSVACLAAYMVAMLFNSPPVYDGLLALDRASTHTLEKQSEESDGAKDG